MSLRSCFPDKSCEIFVLDTTQYDTWTKNADKVTFVKDSAENLGKLFAEETVDLIFANRVFHHFVKSSWRKSFRGMACIMRQAALTLKKNGLLCITDHFYEGRLHHTSASRVIYALTSISFAPIALFFRIDFQHNFYSAPCRACCSANLPSCAPFMPPFFIIPYSAVKNFFFISHVLGNPEFSSNFAA
jgi:SAM-dependent methyltransferase